MRATWKISEVPDRYRSKAMAADGHWGQARPPVGFRVVCFILDKRLAVIAFATGNEDQATIDQLAAISFFSDDDIDYAGGYVLTVLEAIDKLPPK